MITCNPPATQNDINALKNLIYCLKKNLDNLTTIVNNGMLDKPPIYISWDTMVNNKYLNAILKDTTYVIYLNGVRILFEGTDYTDLSSEGGGFEIVNTDLINLQNDYILFR